MLFYCTVAWAFSGDSITDVITLRFDINQRSKLCDSNHLKDNFLPKFVVLSTTETAYQILKEINDV